MIFTFASLTADRLIRVLCGCASNLALRLFPMQISRMMVVRSPKQYHFVSVLLTLRVQSGPRNLSDGIDAFFRALQVYPATNRQRIAPSLCLPLSSLILLLFHISPIPRMSAPSYPPSLPFTRIFSHLFYRLLPIRILYCYVYYPVLYLFYIYVSRRWIAAIHVLMYILIGSAH